MEYVILAGAFFSCLITGVACLCYGYNRGFVDALAEVSEEDLSNQCGHTHDFPGYYCTREKGHDGPCALV